MNLLQAIARQEGWEEMPGSVFFPTLCQRNNNPGNIRFVPGSFTASHSATRGLAGFCLFLSASAGWQALHDLLSGPTYKGKTVQEALNIYAPAADGNAPATYVANVCAWVGCTPDTVIDGLL